MHDEVLFGTSSDPLDIAPLGASGTYATPRVVEVRGPSGILPRVRVIGPHCRQTEVRLSARDADALGMGIAPVPNASDATRGCTLIGARGTVVLATGVIIGLRRLCIPTSLAAAAGIEDGARKSVLVRGDRLRELKEVPVEIGPGPWLVLSIEDANALEVGPTTIATLTP